MKLGFRLKFTLLLTLASLYTTGVLTWVLSNWFQVRTSFGTEAPVMRVIWLQVHSIISLWFLILFGYVFHSHVRPAWKRRKKRLTGSLLTGTLIFLSATVPGLFYLTNESLKDSVALIHTYVGLVAVVIFFVHYTAKRT